MITAWKVSKYGVFSGPYFPVFGLNAGKYGPGKTPYLDIFLAVDLLPMLLPLVLLFSCVLLKFFLKTEESV